MRDESEKEVVHRLEAFSDIVIGFSLAQLALSLTIPRHAIDLFSLQGGARSLIALAVTFVLVCGIWWTHHRLFRRVFVPTPLSILANFAALGGIIFLAYSMQVLVRVGLSDRVAYAMYSGSYAWILLLVAAMAWMGIRARGPHLTGAQRAESFRFAVRASIIGAWLAILTAISARVGPQAPINEYMLPVLVVALAGHRIFLSKAQRAPR